MTADARVLLKRCTSLACAALLAAAQAAGAALVPEIEDTIARLETNRAAVEALDTQITNLQERIARLQTDATANADAITRASARLSARQEERSTSAERIDTLSTRLFEQREAFLARTGVARADLGTHVAALRELEAARALLQRQIGSIRRQLNALQAKPVRNAQAIADKTAALTSKLAALEARQKEIAAARRSFTAFELAMTGGGGSAVLNWSVPTTRANGSPLPASELAGYEIYVLAESTGDTEVIALDDPLRTSYTVTGLAADAYHFSMAAKDTEGNLSELSPVVSKTIAP